MGQQFTRRFVMASGLAACAAPATGQTRAYDLVTSRSQITFTFTAGGVAQSGTLPVETAHIEVDTRRLTNSRAEVTADVRNIKSGLLLVTQAIKSPELLDAETYPMVQFKSTRIRLGANGRISGGAQIDGDLTLRGVTRPLSLQAVLTRPAGTAPDDLSVLNIRLNGTLSRAAFGATGYPGLAEDSVGLDIRAEIYARD